MSRQTRSAVGRIGTHFTPRANEQEIGKESLTLYIIYTNRVTDRMGRKFGAGVTKQCSMRWSHRRDDVNPKLNSVYILELDSTFMHLYLLLFLPAPFAIKI